MQGLNDYSLMLWQQVRGLARRGDDAIGWRAQARLDCVRGALRSADTLTVQELQREFGEIEIATVLSSLLDVLKDAALVVLASTGIGGAAGAAVGALAGGVGAIPGAAAGAALGAKVGCWILAVLGLKALAEFFIEGLPAILDHYRRGLSRAWAAPDHDRAGDDLRGGQRRQSEVRGAAVDISKGHVAMVLLLLSAVVAYLTRGRGNIGQLAAQARRGRLGARFADWLVKHEAALRRHPRLQARNRAAPDEPRAQPAPSAGNQNHRIERHTDVRHRSAAEVNATFPPSWKPPYQPGTRVTEYTTSANEKFVRVHGDNNTAGSWIMKKEAIQGLSPSQIAHKFSLPSVPKYVSDVNVPANTPMRTGKVAGNFGGAEGATQYELLGRIPMSNFSNTRPIPGGG